MAKGIIVIGAVFVDIKGYPDEAYIPTGRNVGRIENVHGGVCRNIAEDIANVELRPTFVSLIDDTGLGLEVKNKLIDHKVNTDYLLSVKDGMGTWLAIFDNNGDVAGSISKRPDLSPLLKLLEEKGDEIFCDCDAIAVEFDMDKEVTKVVFRYAEKYSKPVYSAVSNMRLAIERRDLMLKSACCVCNKLEAGILFSENYEGKTPEEMEEIVTDKVMHTCLNRIVVTLGGEGAVYADKEGNRGIVKPNKVDVIDTTGAGDSFFAGVVIGCTYGKSLGEACAIGTRLAASVIQSKDNVCPRYLPSEFGITVPDYIK